MTHYHYYIQAGAQLDALSRFYLVAIGNSVQANRDYLYLLSHSVDAGHYFEIRSEESTDFVQRCLHSLSDDAAQFSCVAPVIQAIKARDLVRLIKAEIAASLSPLVLHQNHEFRKILNGSYRANSNLSRAAGLAKR